MYLGFLRDKLSIKASPASAARAPDELRKS